MRYRAKGQITVFFALCLTLTFALLLGLLESARTQGARLYVTQAVNSAMDSLFSQYHRTLWKEYRLLGLEHYADEQLCEEVKRFAAPYFEADDWYPSELRTVSVQEKTLLTDLDGQVFEQEVLDYMQYGILDSLWDYATAEKILQDLSEAGALDRVSDLYEDHAKEAVRLEETVGKIAEVLEEQKKLFEEAAEAVAQHSGGRFIRILREMKAWLEELPELIQVYEKQADALSAALLQSRERYEAEKTELSELSRTQMEQTLQEYASYVDEDGIRRQEIVGLRPRSEANCLFLNEVIEEAEEAEEYIASWEPEDEDDELDEAAVWAPVEHHFLQYSLLHFGGAGGVADKEKEGFLEQVGTLLKGNLLEILLPEGVSVSKTPLPLFNAPSKTCFSGVNGCRLTLWERVLMGEYTLKSLHFYGRERFGSSPEKKGSGGLEIEYVLNGKENDYENLSDTAMRLIAIREGMNLVYLFQDSEKRTQARALAAVITGAAGFTPLILVVTFFILGVWALGQALCDVRDLLAGKNVPLLHGRDTFYLSLEGLLSIGKNGRLEAGNGKEERGISYETYLRLLLFQGQSALYEYRTMDIIQMNIQSRQEDFQLNRCLYSLKIGAEAEAGHVMAELGLLRDVMPIKNTHAVKLNTFCKY